MRSHGSVAPQFVLNNQHFSLMLWVIRYSQSICSREQSRLRVLTGILLVATLAVCT